MATRAEIDTAYTTINDFYNRLSARPDLDSNNITDSILTSAEISTMNSALAIGGITVMPLTHGAAKTACASALTYLSNARTPFYLKTWFMVGAPAILLAGIAGVVIYKRKKKSY